jgi:hypothetical protein
MRKALGTTVQAEVAEQLNKLINGQYRWASKCVVLRVIGCRNCCH